jgi:hypothetical protein
MSAAVYILCATTSLVCAVLLLRGLRTTGLRLLLWSGICFLALTLDNVMLFADHITGPDVDLSTARQLVALGGLSLLLFGLVWER